MNTKFLLLHTKNDYTYEDNTVVSISATDILYMARIGEHKHTEIHLKNSDDKDTFAVAEAPEKIIEMINA